MGSKGQALQQGAEKIRNQGTEDDYAHKNKEESNIYGHGLVFQLVGKPLDKQRRKAAVIAAFRRTGVSLGQGQGDHVGQEPYDLSRKSLDLTENQEKDDDPQSDEIHGADLNTLKNHDL